MLDKHRKSRAPNGSNSEGVCEGYRAQRASARVRPRQGAIANGKKLAESGEDCSLRNSFSASAMGWGRPIRRTLLGPFRS